MKKKPISAPKVEPRGIFATRRVCFLKHITDIKLPVTVMGSEGLKTILKEEMCPLCAGPTIGIALFRENDEPDEVLVSTEALERAAPPKNRFEKPDGEMVQEYCAILKEPFERSTKSVRWRY